MDLMVLLQTSLGGIKFNKSIRLLTKCDEKAVMTSESRERKLEVRLPLRMRVRSSPHQPRSAQPVTPSRRKAKPRHRPQRPMTSKGEGSRDLLTNVDLLKVQPRKVSSPNGTNKKTLTQVSRNVKVSITPFCPLSSPQGFLHVGFSEDERFHFSSHVVVVAQTLNYNRDPIPCPSKLPKPRNNNKIQQLFCFIYLFLLEGVYTLFGVFGSGYATH